MRRVAFLTFFRAKMNLGCSFHRGSVHALKRNFVFYRLINLPKFHNSRLMAFPSCLNTYCSVYWSSRPLSMKTSSPEDNGVTRKLKMWKRENIYTIPNGLCVVRIGLTPLIVVYMIKSQFALSLALFVLAGFSDLLDGFIARAFSSQRSNFGSILDPLADKLFVGSIFITLCATSHLPLYLVVLTALKDFSLLMGAFAVRFKTLPPGDAGCSKFSFSRFFDPTISTVDVHPTILGKVNTVLQVSLIFSTLCSLVWPLEILQRLVDPLVISTACTTVGAAVQYIVSMIKDNWILTQRYLMIILTALDFDFLQDCKYFQPLKFHLFHAWWKFVSEWYLRSWKWFFFNF